jgi:hypothetical protein
MSVSCGRIATLVMKIQNEFLDKAGLTLTLSQAQNRFGADEITCEAVLGALVDAKVLAKTPDGAYIRFFPRLAMRPAGAHSTKRAALQKGTTATHSRAGMAA